MRERTTARGGIGVAARDGMRGFHRVLAAAIATAVLFVSPIASAEWPKPTYDHHAKAKTAPKPAQAKPTATTRTKAKASHDAKPKAKPSPAKPKPAPKKK
jgi:hypothetical protein